MIRTLNAFSDRLLGLVVPQVTAHADPCGGYTEYCGCMNYNKWYRFCCRVTGACSLCRPDTRTYC